MAIRKIDTDLDFSGVGKLVRALMNPVATDPASPAVGEVWFNTASNRFKVNTAGGVVILATLDDVTSGAITGSLWDPQSVVVAVADDTPIAQVLGASTVLGRRASGDITAVSYANLKSDLEALNINAITLGGSNLATVLNRTSHTGTQLASTISDFATAADARITAASLVPTSLYDAQSVVVAVTDNTPVVQTMAASTILGRRASGNITAVSYANLKTDLEGLGLAATTLGGSNLATVVSRANHTGTQLAATISDFNTAADARVAAGIATLVDSAPGTLDTLNELAAALGDDPNFATTITNSLATKTNKYAVNIGNGALQSFVVNHALSTTDVVVSVRQNSDGAVVDCEIVHTDANNVTIEVNSVPANNALRVVVIG